jgi:hypothetical protein
MNTMDNAKVIEKLEKQTLYNYFEKLIHAKMHKLVLFPVFPLTAAANLSEPHYVVLLEDLTKLIGLNSGRFDN